MQDWLTISIWTTRLHDSCRALHSPLWVARCGLNRKVALSRFQKLFSSSLCLTDSLDSRLYLSPYVLHLRNTASLCAVHDFNPRKCRQCGHMFKRIMPYNAHRTTVTILSQIRTRMCLGATTQPHALYNRLQLRFSRCLTRLSQFDPTLPVSRRG